MSENVKVGRQGGKGMWAGGEEVHTPNSSGEERVRARKRA